MTFNDAKAEADAWIASKQGEIATSFNACAAANPLSLCHPTWSSSILPPSSQLDVNLQVVTNDDPGTWVETPCGACYDGRDRWVDGGFDIPNNTPVQVRINSLQMPGNILGAILLARFSFDGLIYEKAVDLLGNAPTFVHDWGVV